ncbi:unnamed protein product [Rotaria magnacalcarata]|uniref:Uncharacterized protein n=1 Tax=Rotaria magnacalcarata TaxID=392030 RepID=A0A816PQE3_9BILA|nr:unnamed protein product [Rotaria magnacalcarata]CAF3975503.1 unnamed protein product [Rotaria magnacalcarata]
MDVLELPRPVINFLRTMAKEGCRYVLSWDIFGGTDSVTLTLTWKLSNHESQLTTSKSLQHYQQQVYDDLFIRHDDLTSSQRRSRREDNTVTSARIRSSRGKSLEGNSLTSNKSVSSQQKQASSLERSSITNQQKKQSVPIYANLKEIKYPTSTSPSPSTHTDHHRTRNQRECPIRRKLIPPKSIANNLSLELRRRTPITIQTGDDDDDDDDEDIVDPWIKDFECSLETGTNNKLEESKIGMNKKGNISGKVKFKRKPDYF